MLSEHVYTVISTAITPKNVNPVHTFLPLAHRYTPSTVSRVLTYLREYVTKLESALAHAERDNDAKEADRLRAVLIELNEYEHDVLFPKATENIEIDLDDGVRINYPKFGMHSHASKGSKKQTTDENRRSKRMNSEVILYNADDGAQMQLRASEGTVWLTQAEMAELYGTSVPNIAQIIRRVLDDREVDEATIHSELIVRREGERDVRRHITVYNLDMILAVGYRVTTPRAVQFRQWATSVLKDYLVKGFAMDDAKLKGSDGWDYFDECLERIRDIRASEKRFYQKVRDLYATAIDYDSSSRVAKAFFATVQNKMLWAVTGQTAAEIISVRSNPEASNMGLTSWSGTVVRKRDMMTPKNYLAAAEITELDRIVTMPRLRRRSSSGTTV